MCEAILTKKIPYSDAYGQGLEFTFESKDLTTGTYKSKKKDYDLNGGRYAFLKELPIGSAVILKKNVQGQGYFINQIEKEKEKENNKIPNIQEKNETEEIFNSLNKEDKEDKKNKISNKAPEEIEVSKENNFKIRAKQAWQEWFNIEEIGREKMLKLGYSLEDIRTVTTGIRIQLR